MKVVYSSRVETELESFLGAGIDRFGRHVAENTSLTIERSLKVTLGERPYLGRLLPARQVYRYVIARTPFVAYYHVDAVAEKITILAIFYGARNRSEFEPD